MPLARTPLLDALVAPLRFPWLELRDRRAGRRLAPVQDRTAAIGPSDVLLVTCLRNERAQSMKPSDESLSTTRKWPTPSRR